jgi:Na+-translocating ferredoxin:NAD+ oxidoreductase RnfD subunit
MNGMMKGNESNRLGGLRRFAIAISILNILGHTLFGFEMAWGTPFVALAAAYSAELILEIVDAHLTHRQARFRGSPMRLVDFLLSAHISGLAVGMLLYANSRIWPVVFAAIAAIASKRVLRMPIGGRSGHFFNPSNFGITLTLLLFPWVGIAPPYHFTTNLDGAGDWVLPGVIICSGTFLNARFTRRLPLIGAWLAGFIVQTLLRHWLLDTRLEAALMPMTGVAFILYTFYMVTDPATTPSKTSEQIAFGAAVAITYGLLMANHIVFGLFFALSIVCGARGAVSILKAYLAARQPAGHAIEGAALAAGDRR